MKPKIKPQKIVFFCINLAMCMVIIMPIVYAACLSLMPPAQLYDYPPPVIPETLYFENYTTALSLAPIFRFILNSFTVAVACTAGQLLTGALAGYAFSMLEFKGKQVLFFIMLSTMMIPGQAIIIANYLTVSRMGLINTYGALILPYLTSAFCVFNMRQAFLQLPVELNEAAIMDGCTPSQFFMKVGLPLVKPNLGALGVYTFLNVWNQYLWPLLVTDSKNMRTVQIGLGMLQNADSNAVGPIMAGGGMILLPSIAVFVFGQKQLIEGLTAGAVKG